MNKKISSYDPYYIFLYNQEYRAKNRTYYQDYAKSYQEKNKESLKEYRKNYYANKNKMKKKGSVIEFKEGKTIIRFD